MPLSFPIARRAALAVLLLACTPAPSERGSSKVRAPAPPAAPTGSPLLPTKEALDADPGASSAALPPPAPSPAPAQPPPSPEDLEPPPPDGFVRIPDPRFGQGDRASCGGLTVHNVFDQEAFNRGESSEPFVRVLDATGNKRYEAHGRKYAVADVKLTMSLVADLCGDVNGDGMPELILTERTIGAHCCYTHYVVSLSQPSKNLLVWEKGDAGTGLWPVKAKPGPTWQLMSRVVSWPPFDVEAGEPALGYGSAPLLPIVFSLEGEQYQARTFRFAPFLRQQRDDARKHCHDKPDECELDELIEWGYALIIGDWATQRGHIDTDPFVMKALDNRAAAMTRQLRSELGH